MMFGCLLTIVKSNIKAARDGDDELVTCAQSMPGARLAAWDIVEIEDSLNFKGNVFVGLNEAQVSSCVGNLGQVNEIGVGIGHIALGQGVRQVITSLVVLELPYWQSFQPAFRRPEDSTHG